MAVIRKIPSCPFCDEPIAKAIHKDFTGYPLEQIVIGDNFIRWEWLDHKCTKESKMKTYNDLVKKHIICDVDGVIVDFKNPYIDFVKSKMPDKKINPSVYELGLTLEENGEMVVKFWEEYGIENLKPFDGTKKYFNILAKKHRMRIASALDPKYEKQRLVNLKGFDYEDLNLISRNKAEWIINQNPDIAIEDKPQNIIKLANAGINVFIPMYVSYTGSMGQYGTFFKSWKELSEII